MISRALGPALGGSIGLMFTVANTISVATYTIGFSESLLDFLQVSLCSFWYYISKSTAFTSHRYIITIIRILLFRMLSQDGMVL